MPAVCTPPMRRPLLALVALLLLLPLPAPAQAPLRAGQPYAEAALCARPDVLFCEDFDYPENFIYTGVIENYNSTWRNPGLTTGTFGYVYGLEGRRIALATAYPAQPAGSPAGGSVWVANWDATKGATGNGATWGRLREAGRNYANGAPPAKEVHIRFQYYVTPDYAWPGDPRSDTYAFGSSSYPVDNKILYLFPPEGVENPTGAAYDAGLFTTVVYDPTTNSRFTDALAVRYGDASDNYKHFPMDWDAAYNPSHMEYGPFQSLALRNPGDTPRLGRIFRLDTNRWYTIELRYKLGSGPGVRDGAVEVWIDGSKVYSAFDLATCGGGLGDCSGIGALYLGAYHNGADTTRWDGQQVVDNLVIATSYIGPPGGAASPSPPTTAALTVTKDGLGSGTVASSPAGIACGTDCGQAYALGTVVSLTAAAAAGSSFAGWSGACTGTGGCSLTLDQARTVTATFVQQPAPSLALTVTRAGTGTGTVASSPAGIACGSDCSESYAYGTSVRLTAAAAPGSTFAGWSGACAGTAACVLTMSQARAVTATFSPAAAGDLVAAYGFNPSSGASLPDVSGHGHTGTIRGARWTRGRYGNALQFDGRDDWVTVPDAPDLDLTGGMTLMAWVYPTSSSGARDVLIKEGAGYEIYNLYARQYGGSGSQATVRVNGSLREASGPALPLNAWSHLASTYDGTTLRLYVNGVQRAQVAAGGAIATSSGVLRLGGNSLWGEFFRGKIDEVRIYNRVLGAGEIQAGMNTPLP
ncbi:MAG: LamG-like jellyroll fold domain-containing protein [Candidatus Methylomirabilales bacterium]